MQAVSRSLSLSLSLSFSLSLSVILSLSLCVSTWGKPKPGAFPNELQYQKQKAQRVWLAIDPGAKEPRMIQIRAEELQLHQKAKKKDGLVDVGLIQDAVHYP